MEKNKSQFYSKKVIIACVGLIFILITCGFVLSMIICKEPILWYEVEYINCNSNILIQTYQRGDKLSLPDNPERIGYKFIGWSLDEEGDSLLSSEEDVVIYKGFTLYAQWQEFTYSLIYGGVPIITFTDTVKFETFDGGLKIYGDGDGLYILDNPSREGSKFIGWSVSIAGVDYLINEYVFDRNILDDLILTPMWEGVECIVSIYSDGTLFTTLNLSYGDLLELPKISKEGFFLKGFVNNNNEPIENLIIKENIDIYAVWEEVKHTARFKSSGGAYVINCDNEYFSGDKSIDVENLSSLTFSISLSKAYDKSKIIVYAATTDGTLVYPCTIDGEFVFKSVSCNLDIYIDGVEINAYNLTVDGKSYGPIEYGSWLWVDNNIIFVRSSTGECIRTISPLIKDSCFEGWELNGEVLVHNYVQDLAVDDTVNIVGKYSKLVARISLNANGGDLSNSEIIYEEGMNINLPTPYKDGFEFVGWFVKLVEINLVVDESVSEKFEKVTDSNMVLYAGWRLR